MSRLVAVALACLLLGGCGVRTQEQPEPLPPDVLPSELQSSTRGDHPQGVATLDDLAGRPPPVLGLHAVGQRRRVRT